MIHGNILLWDFVFPLELLYQQPHPSIQTLPLCLALITLFVLVFKLPTTTTRFKSHQYQMFLDITGRNWPIVIRPFQGNTGTLNIDRGHLLPNGIYNQDLDAAKATFTLTNVAPQVAFIIFIGLLLRLVNTIFSIQYSINKLGINWNVWSENIWRLKFQISTLLSLPVSRCSSFNLKFSNDTRMYKIMMLDKWK